MTMLLIVL